ncbi:tripartite tricarboxylate transporter TctB family protein [Klebsiella sp. BIGb0407]|uniref:tripartite tricarboxylate transporter TctB family protein n=1 Tax=Klebsiella sp. BIGb0407 TaxID=2940603 RepID=UPI002166CA60|nr:tripartite tricarboxylate transporter TctB family protein [Klebsiella sp. BIGb0407]MCS3431314.1 magnesium-transporting ATPase (P-type) [Klebsiella sp. BIGb0407]
MPMLNRHIVSLVMFFFGLFLIGYSTYSLGDFSEYGAAFMPSVVGAGIILFSLTDMLSRKNEDDVPLVTWHEIKFVLIVSGLIIFYILFVDYLGFILTGLIITAPLMMKYARAKAIYSLIISLGVVVGVYYLFTAVLLVPLPQFFS